jgi:Bardet-Biedl syndrome 4 protein
MSRAAPDKGWLVHLLYLRGEYAACEAVIEEQLHAHRALCEHPLVVKGLLRRQQGAVLESLQLFQAASCLNPRSVATLKQVARSLFLLGRHRGAADVYAECERLLAQQARAAAARDGGGGGAPAPAEEWAVWHHKGECLAQLRLHREAEAAFLRANEAARHDATFLALGRLLARQEDFRRAIDVYVEALEFTPENAEMLTTLGLLYLRVGDGLRAFECLGNSLAHDARAPRAILAAGSIIQDKGDFDVALVKYRVAALQTPNSAQLWNNVGMCFFGKGKHVAAIACLKRALYLDPFEWIVAYNLGLLHLHTEQFASAFHFLTAAINLRPGFAAAYVQLGLALARLDDLDNACAAFEKGLALERSAAAHLNFAVTLQSCGRAARAAEQLRLHDEVLAALPAAARAEAAADADAVEARRELGELLGVR